MPREPLTLVYISQKPALTMYRINKGEQKELRGCCWSPKEDSIIFEFNDAMTFDMFVQAAYPGKYHRKFKPNVLSIECYYTIPVPLNDDHALRIFREFIKQCSCLINFDGDCAGYELAFQEFKQGKSTSNAPSPSSQSSWVRAAGMFGFFSGGLLSKTWRGAASGAALGIVVATLVDKYNAASHTPAK